MDLVSSQDWWDMEREEFISLLQMTYMDDYWYFILCDNLSNHNVAKGWIAFLLSESLDLRTHLCIAEKYPTISVSSYDMIRDSMNYEDRPKSFLKKYEDLVSTVISAISLSQ